MTDLLLVEDEVDLREAMEELLIAEGHQVRSFETGEEAVVSLESLTGPPPGAIITDVRLPGMSGIDLLQWVRGNAILKDIPFICISASIPPRMEATLVEQRNVLYIRKPFDIDQFYEVINNILSVQ